MKTKKILYVLFFAMLFCLLGFSKCFASTDYNVDDYDYHFVFSYEGNTFLTTCSDNNIVVGGYGGSLSNGYIIYFLTGSYNTYVLKDESFVSCGLSEYGIRNFTITNLDSFSMTYSDFDIKYDGYWSEKLGEEIFFQKTPLVQGIVAQQVETVEMSQVLQEIVGILPLIIALLVSLVGLRKGLKMLLTFLRMS